MRNIKKSGKIKKFTPLELAAFSTSGNAVRALLDGGAILTKQAKERANFMGNTNIWSAIRQYKQRIAKENIESNNYSILFSDLHKAARYGNHQSISASAQGSNVTIKDSQYGLTPLHVAAEWGNPFCIHALFDKGAEVNAQDNHGATPLFYAQDTETMRALMNHKANPNAQDFLGRTPLHIFCQDQRTDLEALNALLDYRNFFNGRYYEIDVNKQDALGATPLHYAASEGASRAIEILIKAGADTEIRCDIDWTRFKTLRSRCGGILASLSASYCKDHTKEVQNNQKCLCQNQSIDLERKKWTPLEIAVWNACDPELEVLVKNSDILYERNSVVKTLLENGVALTDEAVKIAELSSNEQLKNMLLAHCFAK